MKYLNATSVLPDTLVKELQNYVQGGYIYIPIEQEQQKRWEKLPAIGRNWNNVISKSKGNIGMVFPLNV